MYHKKKTIADWIVYASFEQIKENSIVKRPLVYFPNSSPTSLVENAVAHIPSQCSMAWCARSVYIFSGRSSQGSRRGLFDFHFCHVCHVCTHSCSSLDNNTRSLQRAQVPISRVPLLCCFFFPLVFTCLRLCSCASLSLVSSQHPSQFVYTFLFYPISSVGVHSSFCVFFLEL